MNTTPSSFSRTRTWQLYAATAAALSCSGLAWPQTAPAPGRDQSTTLDEIVITASKHAESSQKVSLPIEIVGPADLAASGFKEIKDLSSMVPGVNVSMAGDAQIYIRGVGTAVAEPTSSPAVAFNLDGVYISNQAALSSSFFDVNRIEILKGPQGTLYGRNASGGAINLITNNPSFNGVSGQASVEFGDYALVDVQAALNVPFNDMIALRAAFQYVKHSGYLSDGTNDEDRKSGRLKLLVAPADNLSILLTADYSKLGGEGEGATVIPAIDPSNPWLGLATPQTNALILNSPLGQFGLLAPLLDNAYQSESNWGIAADVEWDMGFATLSVLPAYRQAPTNYLTNTGGFLFESIEFEKQLSLESRLSHVSENIKWVAGLYYFKDNTHFETIVDYGPLSDSLASAPLQKTESYAGFGEATFSVSQDLRVIVGARHTHEEAAVNAGQDTLTDASQSFTYAHSAAFNANNWKLGLEYDVLPQSMAYATASTGFKAGGFYANPGPDYYRPEKLTAYELGIKNRFFEDTLEANVELFYWKYIDKQFSHLSIGTTPTGESTGFPVYGTFNAGRATIKGIDVSLKYRLTADDVFGLAAEYNDSVYDSLVYSQPAGFAPPGTTACGVGAPDTAGNQTINCSGKTLARAPRWSGNGSYEHIFHLPGGSTLTGGVQTHLSSAYFISEDYIPAERASSYTRTDVNIVYRPPSAKWSVGGYVRNVENSAAYNGGYQQPFVTGLVLSTIQPPRTYGVRFSMDF